MFATPIRRALRLAAPALAAVLVAAGGVVVASPASAVDHPCDDPGPGTGVAPGDAPLPCVETVPPTTTVTETATVEELPTETETIAPTAPPPALTTITPPASAPRERLTPATTTPLAPTTTTWSSGGIFGSGARLALAPYNGTPTLSGGPYVFPVVGRASFTDTWGAARATVAWHHGVDIFAPFGSPVVAVADGALFSVGWNTVGGQRLWLRDRAGNYFYYAHLSAFSRVAVNGARVRAGTVIGYVGNTGDAEGTPYHLHFEIHPVSLLSFGYDGAVNPFSYVSSWQRFGDALRAGSKGFSAAAPTPGAILIGITDISSADGLSPGSLEQTLQERPAQEEAAVAAALVSEQQQRAATFNPRGIPPPREDDARVARSLDAEAAHPARYGAGVWDSLAACESGGDWGTHTGNGFVGGLQFLPQTWASHGGTTFAPSAHLATREQQIAVAERVLDSQGWRAWPACSAMLGLRSSTE